MEQKHEEINLLLTDYLRGSLSAEEKRAVEDHLSQCGTCRDDLGLLERISGYEVEDPGQDFFDTLPSRIDAQSRGCGSVVPLGVRPPLRPASLSLAAMAALCILVISVVLRISVGPDCRGSFVQMSPMEEVLSLAEFEEREVPLIAELDRDGLVPSDETLVSCDYYSDLTSLDGEKAERLYEELTRRKGEKDGNDEA